MDGFRDRMNRGTSDRGASDRGSFDRYDRGARRSSLAAPASSAGLSADEVMQIVTDSNSKQLDVINDLFMDARDDRFESEKQIIDAIEEIKASVSGIGSAPAPVAATENVTDTSSEEILKTVTSNADLLAQFAEEQLPMLVRGNSSMLNQIRLNLEEKDDLLREILSKAETQGSGNTNTSSSNEEVLSAAASNNALLNALRSEVAGVRAEIMRTSEKLSGDESAPLDSEDAFTKAQADEMYKNMEENVHAECVKVYRNVLKVVEDQSAATSAAVKASVGSIKGITVLNLVLLILNLAAVLLRIFGLI